MTEDEREALWGEVTISGRRALKYAALALLVFVLVICVAAVCG